MGVIVSQELNNTMISPDSSLQDPQQTGLFVTFEGIDGSGKSTQIQRAGEIIAQRLKQSGSDKQVIITRNPGGTPVGQSIRHLLLNTPKSADDPTTVVSPMCELMLYMADRAHHMETVVVPALQRGWLVLCDRHIDSSVAYQGYGRNLPIDTIHAMNQWATHGKVPDLTLLYDANPELLAQRVTQRNPDQSKDRLEQEAMDFHHRVRDGYLTLARDNAARFHIFNAMESIEALTEQTLNLITKHYTPLQTLTVP